ncbi:MAG: carboxymuconolactone decarboxylase family protein, partial [Streptosporangiaceae bacterium]
MKNPAALVPGAWQAIQSLTSATEQAGLPPATTALVHLRVSQVNGCSSCLHGGASQASKAGETDDRLATVAAWRDAPFFT